MLRPGSTVSAHFIGLLLCLFIFAGSQSQAEIIYDNTSTSLERTFNERYEYGDQVDFGGIARRLTEVHFEYFGRFAEEGDEALRIRIYSNETPYDRFRKAPTTLLYESAWISITAGYHRAILNGLNVPLPLHTATVTVEFAGIAEDEVAGLLFYGPPTIGYSFNEVWLRGATGLWVPVLYSSSDPAKRASTALRLVAETDVALDQFQANTEEQVSLLHGTNRVRLAQTFRPETSGRLNQVVLSMQFTNEPVRVRILDTLGSAPGPNVLGERFVLRGAGREPIHFFDEAIYLKAGTNYAIELSTTALPQGAESHLIASSRNGYSRGDLWSRNDAGGVWTSLTENNDGRTFLDAYFETYIIPAEPNVELAEPRPSDAFDLSEPIEMRLVHRPLEIGTVSQVRFFDGTQELARVTNAPFVFRWTNATAGEHNLSAILEDSFRRPFRSETVNVFVLGAGPAENDNFVRRKALFGLGPRSAKPTSTATIERGEPSLAPDTSRATLWWSWTAYDNTPVTISAQNSSSSGAALSAFTGSSLSGLEPVIHGITQVQFTPKAGVAYAIRVDPVTRGDQVVLDIAVAQARIQRITPSAPRATEPVVLRLNRSSPSLGNLSLLANGVPIASFNPNASVLTNSFATNGIFELTLAGTDHRGIQATSAPVRLTVRPENDAFRHAKLLPAAGGTVPFSSVAATAELIDPIQFGEESRSIWYRWRAPSVGVLTVEMPPGSASTLGIYAARTNGALVTLEAIGNLDSTNKLVFEPAAARTYYFIIAGEEPEASAFAFDFEPFEIGALDYENGTVSLQIPTRLNQRILVETSIDLRSWVRLGEPILGTGLPVTWTAPSPPAAERVRFYRIVQE